jgi:predicted lysophospholipase L1 biosynthesis ABC-type transport system permease subunit
LANAWLPITKHLLGKPFVCTPVKNRNMKHLNFPVIATLMVILVTASSCEAIAGIFKAGFWTAIILIALVVGVILWLVGRSRRK